MLDFNSLLAFSHRHCVAICAVMVPVNLLATTQTILLTALVHPGKRAWVAAGFASLCSGVMVLHVLTWFLVGVIAVPTFVLLTLGSVCLGVNLWAVLSPASLVGVLAHLKEWIGGLLVASRKRLSIRSSLLP